MKRTNRRASGVALVAAAWALSGSTAVAQRPELARFHELRASEAGRVVDVVGGGDVTGDGLDDVVVSIDAGFEYARVLPGGAPRSAWVEFTDQLNGGRIDGGVPSEGGIACPVGVVGDASGDGIGEVLLATCADGRSGDAAPLRAFVVYGSSGQIDDVSLDQLAAQGRGFELALERPRQGDVPRTVSPLADLDGRGSPGFVVAFGPADIDLDHRNPPPMTVRVYRFDGRGSAEVWAQYEGGSPAQARSAGDFDGDGREDIVVVDVAYDAPAVRVLRLPEEASAEPLPLRDLGPHELRVVELSTEGETPSDGHGAGIGDFDGDGYDDVGVGQAGRSHDRSLGFDLITFGAPRGAEARRLRLSRGDTIGVPMRGVGDLDGDGFDEVLLTRWDAVHTSVRVLYGRLGDEGADPLDHPDLLLHRPTAEAGTGFGQRAAASVAADGSPTVVIADAARGSLYSYFTPGAVVPRGVAFDGDPGSADRVTPRSPSAGAASLAVGWRAEAGFDARRVVIARDDVFADALSAAPLLEGGVLLLGPSEGPTQELLDEVERLVQTDATIRPETATVFLIGGEDALSERYQTTTLELRGVRRVSGASRVETSVEVARLVAELNGGAPVPQVGVARAYGTPTDESAAWVDSVTAGGWAADTGTPVLLTSGDRLHPAVAAAVEELGVTSSVVFGGVAAVREAAAAALPSPVRVAGSERAGTAAAIAEQLWPEGTSRRLLVNAYRSDGWQYGLPAAALSAESDAPLLLSATDTLPVATREALGCGMDLLLLGDERVIEPDAEGEALDATSC